MPLFIPADQTIFEANQVTADTIDAVAKWCCGTVRGDTILLRVPVGFGTLRPVAAAVGDWIVARTDGGFFVRPDDDFREQYIPADSLASS